MPSPRSMSGRTVRACGRCRCRDRAASGTACRASAACDRALHRLVGDMQACGCDPTRAACSREIVLRGCRAPARTAASRSRSRAITGSFGSSRATSVCAMSAHAAALGRGGRTPRRPRGSGSISPASASSLRWREMRGCDWRRIWVRSETVSSASASSARMRRRVPSPAARSASCRSRNQAAPDA